LSEGIELPFPESAVSLDPIRRAFHWFGNQAAAVYASVLAPHDELGAFEHAQMLRDGREGHFVRGGKVADGSLAAREAREDAAASRVGKRGERRIERGRMVNHMV
jgi:hypothetical protein